jgi:hypothetical protein
VVLDDGLDKNELAITGSNVQWKDEISKDGIDGVSKMRLSFALG